MITHMKEKIEKNYFIFMVVIGIIGSFIFLYVGYLISGFIGKDIKMSVLLTHPFGNYYNEFSPIIMLFAFVVYEIIFFLVMIKRSKKSNSDEKDNEIKQDNIKEATEEKSISIEEDVYDFNDELLKQMEENREIKEDNEIKKDEVQCDDMKTDTFLEKYALSSEIMECLIEQGFSKEQIDEISQIKKYMPEVSSQTLNKMFKVSMTAEEISQYIELFYS